MMPCDQRQKLGPFSFLETWVASVLCPFILSVFFFLTPAVRSPRICYFKCLHFLLLPGSSRRPVCRAEWRAR